MLTVCRRQAGDQGIYRSGSLIAMLLGMGTPADRRPVIVGLDGSKTDNVSFGVAAAEAARRATSLVAVHAWLITDDRLPSRAVPASIRPSRFG